MPKVHCHICGATLRNALQWRRLSRPDLSDVVYVCRDEERCRTRAAYDPVTGRRGDVRDHQRQRR